MGTASTDDFCPRPQTPSAQHVSFVVCCSYRSSKPGVSSTLLSLQQETCRTVIHSPETLTAKINNPIVFVF